jgi:site-specific DNA-methyltransferase (adenine-specific)
MNTLMHGDSLAILPTLAGGSVDFALTDPPYLVNYTSEFNSEVHHPKR